MSSIPRFGAVSFTRSKTVLVTDALRSLLRDRKIKGRAAGTLECYRVKAGHLTRILGASLCCTK